MIVGGSTLNTTMMTPYQTPITQKRLERYDRGDRSDRYKEINDLNEPKDPDDFFLGY